MLTSSVRWSQAGPRLERSEWVMRGDGGAAATCGRSLSYTHTHTQTQSSRLLCPAHTLHTPQRHPLHQAERL